jgi:hypothetical protein
MQVSRKDPHLNDLVELLDRHIESAKGDIPLAWSYLSTAEYATVKEEVSRCQDFRYYSENYHVIQSESEGMKCLSPWWESQEIFYSYVLADQQAGKQVKILVLKARQEGISEIVQAMLFHKTIFTAAVNTLVIAQDPGQSGYLFNKSRMAYDSLPWWMRPEIRYDEAGTHMVFDRKDPARRMMDPGLQSRLMVEAANKLTGAAVGKTLRAIHASELSQWFNPEIWSQQLMPTLNAPDMLGVAESTARGRQGLWYRLWRKSVIGEIDWRPVFIEAFRAKKYFTVVQPEEEFDLTPEEEAIRNKIVKVKNVVLPKGFFKWRRNKIQEFVAAEGEEYRFYQEYPLTWMEAFQASGSCAFDRRKLQALLEGTCIPPAFFGEIDLETVKGVPQPHLRVTPVDRDTFIPPAEHRGTRLRIWEKPQSGAHYYIGGDVAEGIQGGDYSALFINKIMPSPYPDIQVASWHGWISPLEFAYVTAACGYWYNTCELAVEFNSSQGSICNQELYRVIDYPNLYRWKHRDRITHFMSNYMGWFTNNKSRSDLIIKFRASIDDNSLVIRDESLIDECMNFSKEEGERRYDSGDNDGLFAAMICNLCAHDSEWGGDHKAEQTETEEEAPRDSRISWVNTDYSPVFDGPRMKGGRGSLGQIYREAAQRSMFDNVRRSPSSDSGEEDWRTS